MKNKKKRSVTLIEMMIVMFLIAMIIGVVAFNYSGSLEQGKVFKTKAAIDKVQMILSLAEANNDLEGEWKKIVNGFPFSPKGSRLDQRWMGRNIHYWPRRKWRDYSLFQQIKKI